jgi:hypothetical protein
VGAAARTIVGALLVGSVVQGHLASWALGLLGFPAMLLAWQWPQARPPYLRPAGGDRAARPRAQPGGAQLAAAP